MASRSFIDGKTALLLTPLISSTCTLLFAHDQDYFLRMLTVPATSDLCNRMLPPYMRSFFAPGLRRVVTFIGVTTWASIGSLYVAGPLLHARGSFGWYRATAALATAHLIFIPWVAPKIEALFHGDETAIEDDEDDDTVKPNIKIMKEWLSVNLVRSFTTDLGAFLCAFIAVSKTFALDH